MSISDAIIVHSDSNVVSEELISQLQEHYGSDKQIYILNVNPPTPTTHTNGDVDSSMLVNDGLDNAGVDELGNASSNQTIQYVILNKDVDINLILQDPQILSQLSINANSGASNDVNEHQHQHHHQMVDGHRDEHDPLAMTLNHQHDTTGHFNLNFHDSNNHHHNNNNNHHLHHQHHQHHNHSHQMSNGHTSENYDMSMMTSPHHLNHQHIQVNNTNGTSNGTSTSSHMYSSMSHHHTNVHQFIQQPQPMSTHQLLASNSMHSDNGTINHALSNLSSSPVYDADESIQRVQVPPPKRKQVEFNYENKRFSYQDAFLRFLAGEKQPTLPEIISEQYRHQQQQHNQHQFSQYQQQQMYQLNGTNQNKNKLI